MEPVNLTSGQLKVMVLIDYVAITYSLPIFYLEFCFKIDISVIFEIN